MSRLSFNSDLVTAFPGTQVYFQPPEKMRIEYPCFVYELDRVQARSADNKAYNFHTKYKVTHIRRQPDGSVVRQVLTVFPKSRHNRSFRADGLYHDIFTIEL